MAELSSLLATGADGRWQPGVNQPLAWLAVLAYFAAAALSARALWLHRRHDEGPFARTSWPPVPDPLLLARFWSVVMLTMVVLGIDRELDLSGLLAQLGRDLAHEQGWYHRRRYVQAVFIGGIGVAGGLTTAALAFTMRRVLPRVKEAVLGLGALVTFNIVRATSLHHIDALLGRGRIHLSWVLEAAGIGLVALSALRQKAGPT